MTDWKMGRQAEVVRQMRAAGRIEMVHYAGAAHRDPVAAAMAELWLERPSASEQDLKDAVLPRFYAGAVATSVRGGPPPAIVARLQAAHVAREAARKHLVELVVADAGALRLLVAQRDRPVVGHEAQAYRAAGEDEERKALEGLTDDEIRIRWASIRLLTEGEIFRAHGR